MGKTCVSVSGFRDLITTNGEPVHARTVVTIVVYSIQTGVEVIAERRVTLFRNTKYATIEKLYTTKAHRRIPKCFKVFTVEGCITYV